MKSIQKLEIPPEISSKEELLNAIDNGARFVVFQYCISIIAFALVRYSPAILVMNEDELEEKAQSYNTLSKTFGWWSFPYGISETLRSLRINRAGGVDMTEDILLNFKESMLASKEVEMLKTNQLFMVPNSDSVSCFDRAISDLEKKFDYDEIAIGLFINTEEYENPYLVIGVNSPLEMAESREVLSDALYKHFTSHTKFTFIDLKMKNEHTKRLLLQGYRKGGQ